jgi:hypothetical protein
MLFMYFHYVYIQQIRSVHVCMQHPGNLLKMRDGRLAYLDFGMCGSLDKKVCVCMCACVRACVHESARVCTRGVCMCVRVACACVCARVACACVCVCVWCVHACVCVWRVRVCVFFGCRCVWLDLTNIHMYV